MEYVTEALTERVHDSGAETRGGQQPILSTTGTRAALAALDARTKTLEAQVRELSAIVHAVALAHRTDS